VTLLCLDPDSSVAPYEQLRTQLAAMAADGTLKPGQKLPTVRQLAADLGLAANTVARAYRELEADNIISTQGRRGTFVRSSALDGHTGMLRDSRTAAVEFTATARRNGLTMAEAMRLVEAAWPRTSA
jgi:DNA-binding transcriptional regulator YhcF (GntR family)